MKTNRSTRYFSNKQEKKVAKTIGGKQTANSGATKFSKGDVYTDEWLLECKTKTKDSNSMTIQREWFEKNNEEAFAMGKSYNAVVIDFGDGKNHYIIDENLFLKLVKYLKEDL